MLQFKKHHRRLIEVADAILAAPTHGVGAGPGLLNKLRLELSRELSQHVSEEFESVHKSGASSEPELTIMMSRYHDELLNWRHDLTACNCAWPEARAFADPTGFGIAFKPIVDALKARVRWEEDTFYPSVFGSRHRLIRFGDTRD